MSIAIEAVFEDGVFKPVAALPFPEHQRVVLMVQTQDDAPLAAPRWHWLESRAIEDNCAGSVSDEVIRQRRED